MESAYGMWKAIEGMKKHRERLYHIQHFSKPMTDTSPPKSLTSRPNGSTKKEKDEIDRIRRINEENSTLLKNIEFIKSRKNEIDNEPDKSELLLVEHRNKMRNKERARSQRVASYEFDLLSNRVHNIRSCIDNEKFLKDYETSRKFFNARSRFNGSHASPIFHHHDPASKSPKSPVKSPGKLPPITSPNSQRNRNNTKKIVDSKNNSNNTSPKVDDNNKKEVENNNDNTVNTPEKEERTTPKEDNNNANPGTTEIKPEINNPESQ